MDNIEYKDGILHFDGISLKDIADKYGTPVYVYSKNNFLQKYNEITDAFKNLNPLICFSIKTCANINIIKILTQSGSGIDIVSGGELYKALKGGCPPEKIVYAGVGKTEKEIRYALENKILMFNVESEPELHLINKVAADLNTTAKIALRVNPDVDAETHKKITTGKKETKFGIYLDQAYEIYKNYKQYSNIDFYGMHLHIGSQILKVEPYEKTIKKAVAFIKNLKKDGVELKSINIGGGYGVRYRPEDEPLNLNKLSEIIQENIEGLNLKLIMEPGRFIAANSGVLLTSVTYIKKTPFKNFIITDGAMNDLIRPTLYEAYHHIYSVSKTDTKITADVVGPVCESGDYLGLGIEIDEPEQDDLLAVMSAGAYGFSMSSNYNARPRLSEILIENNELRVIRKRETYEDLISKEL